MLRVCLPKVATNKKKDILNLIIGQNESYQKQEEVRSRVKETFCQSHWITIDRNAKRLDNIAMHVNKQKLKKDRPPDTSGGNGDEIPERIAEMIETQIVKETER